MKKNAATVQLPLPSRRKDEQEWRIVRVSQLSGGKDRHSKVLTTRGLRDRRVRLSVPTAFQLYDLQNRLGYEQPNKAVDWLINAAKSAIGDLPLVNLEMASTCAGNMAPLTSSISSIVDNCVGSQSVLKLPLESHSNKDDNPCGIHMNILSGTGNVQQLWDYNNTPSYTDILPLQNLPSSSTAALQKTFQPVPSTPAASQVVIESTLQSYKMANSPKLSQHLGINAEMVRANIPNMIMKSVEQHQQQEANMQLMHYASTSVPTFSNGLNFLTSSLSSMVPLASISSYITNIPSLSHPSKNTYGESSGATVRDFVPFQDDEVREFQKFH